MSDLFTIIAAAGSGTRLGAGMNKAFVKIVGLPLIVHTLQALNKCSCCKKVAVVVGKEETDFAQELLEQHKQLFSNLSYEVVAGGSERQFSVDNALKIVPEDCSFVAVHDGARPFIRAEIFEKTFLKARETGAAIVAVKAIDTIKLVDDGFVNQTLQRANVFLVQTPQIFAKELLLEAYEKALKESFVATDDSSIVENFGHKVAVVEGDYDNIKITNPLDLQRATIKLGENK